MGRAKTKEQTAWRKDRNKTIDSDDGNVGNRVCDRNDACIVVVWKLRRIIMWNKLKQLMKDEEGITTVEIILILVVLIALVLIFKEQMTNIVNNIFKTITSQSNKILK